MRVCSLALRVSALCLTLTVISGCQTAGSHGRLVTGVVPAADDVPIAYDVRGSGDTALVFVHCWCCNRTFWHGQLDEFAKDYRVVSLDLAGHGASGSDRTDWSVAGLAGDVQAVADKLGLQRMVFIGHSMGGPVSLEAARRMPGRVIGVVLVDTVQDADFEYPDEMVEQIAAQFEADFPTMMDRMVRTMFPDGAGPQTVQWVIDQADATNRPAALALFRDFVNVDAKASLHLAGVPIRAINAVPRPNSGMRTAVETNRKYADFDAVLMDGVGHYLMLERPEEFNADLQAILAELTAR